MYSLLLTAYNGAILGPIAKLLGYIMNVIFIVLDKIGIPNVGLCIILFTLIMYGLMTPLTYKQQKFSKLSQRMNPVLQAIQAKYKNKKDQVSMQKMNDETRAIYDKYGVSPTGSCVQLLITMPVLFALYRVIYAIPAYVSKIGDTYRVLADKIISFDNAKFLQNSGIESINKVINQYGQELTKGENISNGVIDVISKISSSDLYTISDKYDLSKLTYNSQLIISKIDTNGKILERGLLDTYNNFLGLNIGDSPSHIITTAWTNVNGIQWGLIIGALLIPILAALSQWINTKLMPQPSDNKGNSQADTMNATMKSMNTMMPIMSAIFCFSFPSGVGIYWIAGAVIRSIQQVVINKKIDKEDVEDIIKKNADKAKEKAKKRAENAEKVAQYGSMSTKTASFSGNANLSKKEKEEAYNKAMELRKNNIKPGSLAAKANLVNDYNERNNKGDK